MNHKQLIFIAAALALVAALPLGNAVNVGCVDARGATAQAIIPPSGQVTNFTPDCLVIANGQSASWTNTDSQVHDPTLWGCFDPGLLGSAKTMTTSLHWDEATRVLSATSPDGTPVPCLDVGPEGNTLIEVKEQEVVLTYFCQVHPLAMIGKVIVNK